MEIEKSGREEAQWYVVSCLTHKEHFAEKNLKLQGFQTFMPCYRKTIRHARRLTSKSAALFPGYFFIKLNLQRDRWRSINGTRGVRTLLMAGQKPVPVPAEFIAEFLPRGNAEMVDLSANIKPGEAVKILSGPFSGLIGMLERLDGKNRVRVLLQIMSGTICVQLEQSDIFPVAA